MDLKDKTKTKTKNEKPSPATKYFRIKKRQAQGGSLHLLSMFYGTAETSLLTQRQAAEPEGFLEGLIRNERDFFSSGRDLFSKCITYTLKMKVL